MQELLNTLYVQAQGAVLRLDHDALVVRQEGQIRLRLPLLRLNGLVLFGRVTITPNLIHRCADDGRPIVWLSRGGRFKARIDAPTRGNVLLRRAQHLALSDPERPTRIARQIVAAKLQNSRQVLLRAARDVTENAAATALTEAAEHLTEGLGRLHTATDLDTVRGVEGDGARGYFGALGYAIRGGPAFVLDGRTRRPPRDRANCLLSFLYALLRNECVAALEGVGLDPQVGYLHALRPGRPALALDLMEELRAPLADRLALVLINRRQLRPDHFEDQPGGAVYLSDEGRRIVLAAYQRRKEEEVEHRILQQKLPWGLVPHIQARLLARYLRREVNDYMPFMHR